MGYFIGQGNLEDEYLAARCLCSQDFMDFTWERNLAA